MIDESLESFAQRLRAGMAALATAQSCDPADRGWVERGASLREQSLPDEEFGALALELFQLQFERNHPYRKFCEHRGRTPPRVGAWSLIPAVPAAAFRDSALSCIPEPQRTQVFFSSGTTGHLPSRHFHHQASLAIYEASVVAWFKVHFLPAPALAGLVPNSHEQSIAGPVFPGKVLALTPPPEQAPHSSLVHMFDTLRCALSWSEFLFSGSARPGGGWVVDYARVLELLQAAARTNEPVMLLGTAFSYVHLLDHLAEQELQFRLPMGSRVLETGGYKGRSRALPKAELHALMTRWLGIDAGQVVCEYGMSELSSQAYNRPAPPFGHLDAPAGAPANQPPRCLRFPPWTRIQIISPETGEEVPDGHTGLLRAFDLANVYSVQALQTEDLARRSGDGFELIGRAEPAEARGCSLMADR